MDHGSESRVDAHGKVDVERWSGAAASQAEDLVAEEVPVALVYGGISHAVMLATPQDLEDFALGFSLSEGILQSPRELHDLEIIEQASGIEARMEIAAERMQALKGRRRTLAGRTGCGLCGVDSLDQLAGRMQRLTLESRRPKEGARGDGGRGGMARLSGAALARAAEELQLMQTLFHLTGAVHAAAWCDAGGTVHLVREDVGRHNALDKLIGAQATECGAGSEGAPFGDGFLLMTSRASVEIVQKAATVGIDVVAAVSAPTGMAVRMAEAAGVTLIGFARGERYSVYSHPGRLH